MKKRSVGVTILGVLFVLGGLLALLTPPLLRGLADLPQFTPEQQEQLRQALGGTKQILMTVSGVASLAAGIGLFLLQSWARVLTLVLAAVSMVQGAWGFLSLLATGGHTAGSPDQPGGGVIHALSLFVIACSVFGWNGLILWYFLRSSVKAQFSKTADSS